MTYKELHEKMQSYMQTNGIIKGYRSQQENMARRPCHDVIEKSDYSDVLSIKDSSGAGIFYDIYAKVDENYSVFVGCFENRGGIDRQSIKVSFLDLDKYGNLDALLAFKRIASKQITKRLDDYGMERQARLAGIKELEDKMDHLRPILARISN